MIQWRTGIAFLAGEHQTQELRAALGRYDQRPVDPGWIVANVLIVSALKLGYPMPLIILVKADDSLLHVRECNPMHFWNSKCMSVETA